QDVADRVVGVRRRVALLIHHRDEAIQLVIDVIDTRRLSLQPARYEQGAENYDRDRIRCGDGTVSIRCGHKSVRSEARSGPEAGWPSAELSNQEFSHATRASPNVVQAALDSGQVRYIGSRARVVAVWRSDRLSVSDPALRGSPGT